VKAIVDYVRAVSNKRVAPCKTKVKTIVLDDPKRLVKEPGLDEGISANHSCARAPNGVAFKEHEEVVLAWPAGVGRPDLIAVLINNSLGTEAKGGVRLPGKSLDLNLECFRVQTVV